MSSFNNSLQEKEESLQSTAYQQTEFANDSLFLPSPNSASLRMTISPPDLGNKGPAMEDEFDELDAFLNSAAVEIV